MKVSLTWLKDYVQYGVTPEKLNHRLTMAGLEVEKEETVKGHKVFEIEVTPNRPDCLNMVGVAREVSAILNKPLKFPAIKKLKKPRSAASITIENKKDCGRYIGTVIRNVSVKAAPVSVKTKIESLGIRPVNNVVDITNFCLMELGQPLHAFDYDKLEGGKIIVRRAKKGEKIVTIDGNTYKLDPSILVIADAKRPVAIAGVMGGQETEVTASTKNILLESAYFDPILVRRASRKLKLSSDSSYRFERGVDVNMVEGCSHRATNLISQHCGGTINAYTDKFQGKPSKRRESISIRQNDINSLLGANISISKSKNILKKLGCGVTATKSQLRIAPPSYRNDIKEKVDIIEEVSRIIGYDNLPETIPNIQIANIGDNEFTKFKDRLRNTIVGYGFNETITFTMSNAADLAKSGYPDRNCLHIQNPLTLDQELMRPDILTSHIKVVDTNINRGCKGLKIFEIGKHYDGSGCEHERLALTAVGSKGDDWRQAKNSPLDLFDLKGVVERILNHHGVYNIHFEESAHDWAYQPNQAATIKAGSKNLGSLGRVSQDIIERWDLKEDNIYFADIDLEWLFKNALPAQSFQKISEYPDVVRDISLAIKGGVSYQQIVDVVQAQKIDIVKDVRLLEQYIGEKLPAGHRGLVISLTYQSKSRTLREEEVHKAHEAITQALIEQLAAIRR